jgi:AhpD family alkylhydroperoxidase
MKADPRRRARSAPVAGQLFRAALRRSPDQISYVRAVSRGAADALTARVYDQVERDFGLLAPPTALHSAAPGPLAASWMILRESLVADGLVSRPAKEAVAAAVSLSNSCPYCVQVHSAAVHGLTGAADAGALAGDQLAELTDPQSRRLAEWARQSRQRDVAGAERPFTDAEAPEVIGTAATFHYLNRMVNIFLADSPLPANLPAAARSNAGPVLGWYMGMIADTAHPAGRSLFLLEPAEPAPDLNWAIGNPTVLAAFARACAAVDTAGAQYIPDSVRALVLDALRDWDGNDPGLTGWLTEALAPLPDPDRPVGRLAMLTAFASYRVDRTVIDLCRGRGHESDDEALISITAWASLAAARQIASWHDAK